MNQVSNTIERRTYTVPEAALVAGVGTASIYRGLKAGMIPCIRVGSRYLIPRHAFHHWLDTAGNRLDV